MYTELVASSLNIRPNSYLADPSLGIIYMSHGSGYLGAQCAHCHNIVWINPTRNDVLQEEPPEGVPDYGEGWKDYKKDRDQRFLQSLPSCPECGTNSYDEMITNVTLGRWSNGCEFSWDNLDKEQLKPLDPEKTLVWVYEEEG